MPFEGIYAFIRRSEEPAARHQEALRDRVMSTSNNTRSELTLTPCHHQRQVNEAVREAPFIVVPRQNFNHIAANHQR